MQFDLEVLQELQTLVNGCPTLFSIMGLPMHKHAMWTIYTPEKARNSTNKYTIG